MVVMYNYSQAFKSIDFELLLAKMKYYWFSETVFYLFLSYLESRLQVTCE